MFTGLPLWMGGGQWMILMIDGRIEIKRKNLFREWLRTGRIQDREPCRDFGIGHPTIWDGGPGLPCRKLHLRRPSEDVGQQGAKMSKL